MQTACRPCLPSKEETISKQLIHELALAAEHGEKTFPDIVKRLIEVGVESYLVDFASRQKIYYQTDGITHTLSMILDPGPIAAVG